MKKTLLYAALLGVLAAAAPFTVLLLPAGTPSAGDTPQATPAPTVEVPALTPPPLAASPATDADAAAALTLYDDAVGQTITVPVEEFLLGAAACELPPDWPDDAILA